MKNIIKLVVGLFFVLGVSLGAAPYLLDNAHSHVGFSVKHLMISNVKGEFRDFTGVIDFDSESKSFNVFNGVVKTKSVDTEIVKRDKHLRSDDFFSSKDYPNMTFIMKSYKEDDDEGEMIGDLTIRGVTKEVKFEVEEIATIKDFQGKNRVGFTMEGKINRSDFGLKWNKVLELGGVAVGDKIKILIEIEAIEK